MGIVVACSLSQMIESGQSPAVLIAAAINRLGHADVKARWEQVESLTKHPREGDSEPTRMGI